MMMMVLADIITLVFQQAVVFAIQNATWNKVRDKVHIEYRCDLFSYCVRDDVHTLMWSIVSSNVPLSIN